MMLGKRSRPPMRRTTSMTEFSFDLSPPESTHPSHAAPTQQPPTLHMQRDNYSALATQSGVSRRSSGDFGATETAAFLKSCGLCKRRLGPGRDTFMYRGDTAFCSLECRHQQISQDERNAKCLLALKKEAPLLTANAAEGSNVGETIAAA